MAHPLDPAAALVRHWGGPSPEIAVQHAVDQLLRQAEVDHPPAPLDLLASFRGIRRIRRADLNVAGMLHSDQHGWLISINAAHNAGRQNFSIAHEICHTFFHEALNPSDASPDGHLRFRADSVTGAFDYDGDREEWLCDLGAARMILHPRWLQRLTGSAAPSLDTLAAVSDACAASLEAAAVQLTAQQIWDAVFVYWTPTEAGLQPHRVYAADGAEDVWNLRPTRASPICQALDGQSRPVARLGRWLAESWYAGYVDPCGRQIHRILSLLRERPT